MLQISKEELIKISKAVHEEYDRKNKEIAKSLTTDPQFSFKPFDQVIEWLLLWTARKGKSTAKFDLINLVEDYPFRAINTSKTDFLTNKRLYTLDISKRKKQVEYVYGVEEYALWMIPDKIKENTYRDYKPTLVYQIAEELIDESLSTKDSKKYVEKYLSKKHARKQVVSMIKHSYATYLQNKYCQNYLLKHVREIYGDNGKKLLKSITNGNNIILEFEW